MNSDKRDGGSFAPSPGRAPRGAKKKEMKPASSSIPSDWYDEESCSEAMHERKSSVQTAIIARGAKLKTNKTDATMPTMITSESAASDVLSHSSVGVYQIFFSAPIAALSWCKYSPAGRMPRWPIRPGI